MGKSNPSSKVSAVKKTFKVKHSSSGGGGGGKPSGAVLTILNKAAAMKLGLGKDHLERKQLSALTGINGKSTIANALTKMKENEWMVVTPESIVITDKGVQAADQDAVKKAMEDTPTTNAKYLANLKEQHKLNGKAVALIDFVLDGKTYPKDKVAAAIALKMNSTFANLLTKLKKLGIIEFDQKTIRLTDQMFPFEPRAE